MHAPLFEPHIPSSICFEPSESRSRSRLDELAGKLASLVSEGSVERTVELGRVVIEELYAGDLAAWRSRGPKAHSLRALARRMDLPISSSVLYRSIALYELSERTGGIERWAAVGLGVSHLRLVLGLGHDEQLRLLDAAALRSWTVAELEREVVAARDHVPARASRGGRPRMPRFLKSVNRLRKAAEAPAEELFGDLEAAADMAPQQILEIRDALAHIRARCAELDRRLEGAHTTEA